MGRGGGGHGGGDCTTFFAMKHCKIQVKVNVEVNLCRSNCNVAIFGVEHSSFVGLQGPKNDECSAPKIATLQFTLVKLTSTLTLPCIFQGFSFKNGQKTNLEIAISAIPGLPAQSGDQWVNNAVGRSRANNAIERLVGH